MFLRTLLAATFLAAPAAASTSLYEAEGFGELDVAFGFADFIDTDGDETDVSVTGLLDFLAPSLDLLVSDVASGGPLLASSSALSAVLDLVDGGEDTLTVRFGSLTGSIADTIASGEVFAIFGFEDDDAFEDGDFLVFDPVSVEITAAPVPLPGGLPLLAAGLLGFAVLRRRR